MAGFCSAYHPEDIPADLRCNLGQLFFIMHNVAECFCKNNNYFANYYYFCMLYQHGVWRSWLAHLVWDQRVVCSSHITPTMIIEAGNIHKSFGTLEVLKGVDFCVSKGEVVAVVGASGAGKSTLLQILGTLSTPDMGTLMIDGTDVLRLGGKALSAFRNKKIGFVFQAHHLLPEFNALENVMIPALIGGIPQRDAREKAVSLLDAVGLSGRLEHKPSELSGGEQQRVSIARALVNSPAILFADEPTGNLDSRTKEDIHHLLFSLRETLGQTLVIVTHDPALAALCDRTCTMRDGLFV